jgi:hypothetical protein
VTGTAFQNPDGTIGLGFNVVAAPGGAPSHIDATVTLPAASGTWRDIQGNSGSFVLTSGAGIGGSRRPLFSSTLSFTRAVNFTFTTPTALVPLTSTAETSVAFTLAAPGPRVLTFSAECAIDGDAFAYLDLDILHNGTALSPTAGAQEAWCFGQRNGAPGWLGARRNHPGGLGRRRRQHHPGAGAPEQHQHHRLDRRYLPGPPLTSDAGVSITRVCSTTRLPPRAVRLC